MSSNSVAERIAKQLRSRAHGQRLAGKPSAELLEQAAKELDYLASRCLALETELVKARRDSDEDE